VAQLEKWDICSGKKKYSHKPPLGNRFFLPFRIQLSLPWLRTLYEGTLLSMELAKDATGLPFVHHTPALPPSACIAWAVFPASDIGS
jgi:hypothetical protein